MTQPIRDAHYRVITSRLLEKMVAAETYDELVEARNLLQEWYQQQNDQLIDKRLKLLRDLNALEHSQKGGAA